MELTVEFVKNHPGVLYKGIPLVVLIYYAFPLMYLAWLWSPWLISLYLFWTKIPDSVKNGVFDLVKLGTQQELADALLKFVKEKAM